MRRTIDNVFVVIGILAIALAIFIGGCSANQAATQQTLMTLKDLAQSGNVQGSIKLHTSGMAELGMKEGFYMGSEGSTLDADLQYRFSDPNQEK